MNKDLKILMIPIVTLVSYLFNDPNIDQGFIELSFVGRMKHYLKWLEEENDTDKVD